MDIRLYYHIFLAYYNVQYFLCKIINYCQNFEKVSGLAPDRQLSKILTLSTNVDQKSLETVFLIAICGPTGDKWQSKILLPAIFDPCSLVVKNIFEYRLSGVGLNKAKLATYSHKSNNC